MFLSLVSDSLWCPFGPECHRWWGNAASSCGIEDVSHSRSQDQWDSQTRPNCPTWRVGLPAGYDSVWSSPLLCSATEIVSLVSRSRKLKGLSSSLCDCILFFYLKEMAYELCSLRFRTKKAPSLGTRISMCSAWTRERLEWYHLENRLLFYSTLTLPVPFSLLGSNKLSTDFGSLRSLTLYSHVRLAEVRDCPASSRIHCSAEACPCSGRWGSRGCQTPGCQSGRSGWSLTPDVSGSCSVGLDLSAWKRTNHTQNTGWRWLTQTLMLKLQNNGRSINSAEGAFTGWGSWGHI